VNLRIREKTAKVARVQSKYAEWWLVLVDHIAYAHLDGHDVHMLQINRCEPWQRIVLISPLEHASIHL
jgi:hypothetical protein